MHMILSLACDALVPVGPESGPGLGAAGHPSCGGWVSHLPSVSWVCTVPAAMWAVLGKSADITHTNPRLRRKKSLTLCQTMGGRNPNHEPLLTKIVSVIFSASPQGCCLRKTEAVHQRMQKGIAKVISIQTKRGHGALKEDIVNEDLLWQLDCAY